MIRRVALPLPDRLGPLVALLGLVAVLLLLPSVAPAGPTLLHRHGRLPRQHRRRGGGRLHRLSRMLREFRRVRKRSCQDERACLDNHGLVGESACRGEFACSDNEGTVGKNACVGVFAACKSRSRSSWERAPARAPLRAPGPSRTPPRSARTPVSAGMLVLTIQARWEHRPVAASSRAPGTPGRSARSPAGAIMSARIAWARSATTPVSARKHAFSPGEIGQGACQGDRACSTTPAPSRKGRERNRPWVACVCEIPISRDSFRVSERMAPAPRRSVFKTERSPHTSHLPGFRASVIGRMPAPWLGAMPRLFAASRGGTGACRSIDVERRHHRARQVDQAALDEGVVRDAERHDVLGALLLGSLSLVVNFDAPEAAADLRQLAGVAALQSLRPIAAGIHIAAFRLPPATTLNPGMVVSANRSKGGTEVPHPHAHTPGPGPSARRGGARAVDAPSLACHARCSRSSRQCP